MIREDLIYHEPDTLLRMSLMDGQARVFFCRTTRMTQQAADIHMASDVAASAMGRMLSAGAMLSAMIKEEQGSVTISTRGDGLGGRLTVVGRGGTLKIAVDNPQADLPLNKQGKQDVGGFVGRKGQLTVIKDMGKGEPYIGISNLVSGELGLDFAEYFTMSEQTPSLVALGCLNQNGVVLSAGGILIQAMPGCEQSVIDQLELREPFFAGVSRELYDMGLEELARNWFDGLDMRILSSEPLTLQCDCSLRRMESALQALQLAELREIAQSDEDTVMTCHFCRNAHHITPGRVRQLLEEKEARA